MNKLVINVEGHSPRGSKLLKMDVYLIKPDDPAWLDAQHETRKRVKKHPASEEEIEQMLDMLGLSA